MLTTRLIPARGATFCDAAFHAEIDRTAARLRRGQSGGHPSSMPLGQRQVNSEQEIQGFDAGKKSTVHRPSTSSTPSAPHGRERPASTSDNVGGITVTALGRRSRAMRSVSHFKIGTFDPIGMGFGPVDNGYSGSTSGCAGSVRGRGLGLLRRATTGKELSNVAGPTPDQISAHPARTQTASSLRPYWGDGYHNGRTLDWVGSHIIDAIASEFA